MKKMTFVFLFTITLSLFAQAVDSDSQIMLDYLDRNFSYFRQVQMTLRDNYLQIGYNFPIFKKQNLAWRVHWESFNLGQNIFISEVFFNLGRFSLQQIFFHRWPSQWYVLNSPDQKKRLNQTRVSFSFSERIKSVVLLQKYNQKYLDKIYTRYTLSENLMFDAGGYSLLNQSVRPAWFVRLEYDFSKLIKLPVPYSAVWSRQIKKFFHQARQNTEVNKAKHFFISY